MNDRSPRLEAFLRRFDLTARVAFQRKPDLKALYRLIEFAQREFPGRNVNDLKRDLSRMRRTLNRRTGLRYKVWPTDTW